jgi:hypothetical protein
MPSIYHTNTASVSVNYEGSHDVQYLPETEDYITYFLRKQSTYEEKIVSTKLKFQCYRLNSYSSHSSTSIFHSLFSSHLLLQHPLKYPFFALQPTFMPITSILVVLCCTWKWITLLHNLWCTETIKKIQLISGMKQNMNLHEKHCCYCL